MHEAEHTVWDAAFGAVRRSCGRRPRRVRPQTVEWPAMAPKQRQVRLEQRGAMEAIQALEQRSDEELEAETKYKSAAMAILGARASERFDADAARSYFQRAIAAARPQERMQIRRMADASLALAERRAGDLKERGGAHGTGAAQRQADVRAARHGSAHPPLLGRPADPHARRAADHPADPGAAGDRAWHRRVDLTPLRRPRGWRRGSCWGCSW